MCDALEPRTGESVTRQKSRPLRSAKRRRNPIPPTSSRIPATPVNGRRSSMAKGSTTNLAEQNAERAMYAANHGMDWMREIAERSLNQSRTMFEEFLTTGRTTVDIIDRQASEVRERSMSLAAETILSTFDFA